MSQPFKFRRATKVATSTNAFDQINKLAALSVRPTTEFRHYPFKVNFDNAFMMAFFEAARTSETVLTVGEHVFNLFEKFGYDYENTKLRASHTHEIHTVLAWSAEGHLLIINKRVAVLDGVRKPVWFRRLPLAVQVTIPVRGAADQNAELGYNPSNLPALTGQSYDAVRGDYMALTSVGKKWRNPGKIAQIKRADTGLSTLAVNDAVTREQKAAFEIALEKAQAERQQAETRIEALIAEMNERSIRSEASAFSANAAVQTLLTQKDAIIVPAAQVDFSAQQQAMVDAVMQAVNARIDSVFAAQAAPAAVQAAPAPARRGRPRKAQAAAQG